MDFNKDLTDEQKAKISACKTPEDVLALAKEEGYELTEDELEMIAGGAEWRCGEGHYGYVFIRK